MPYGNFPQTGRGRRRGSSRSNLAFRQGGTGATYSGSQSIIRHSTVVTGTLPDGETTALPLVCYNPTRAGTPYAVDGSSAKVRLTNFCDLGSRVDYVTVQLTLKQTDTSKNNTAYVGTISTSFNQARLSDTLMDNQFGNGDKSFIEDEGDGEMNTHQTDLPMTLNLTTYSLRDILQHNVKNLIRPQFQMYSGRVVTANQTIPLPRRNKRQQEGSLFALVLMNDSAPEGSDIDYRLDCFFKEIPASAV